MENRERRSAVEAIYYWVTHSDSPPELSNVMFHVDTLPSARYKPQYYLKLSTDQGVASGEGSYGYGTDVQFSVSSPVNSTGAQWVFDGWYDENGNLIATSATGSIVMDRSHILHAKYHLTSTATTTATTATTATLVLGFAILLIPVVVIILVVLTVTTRLRRRRPAAPKAAATMMPTAPPVAPSVKYCLQCGEPIPLDVNFCEHCGAKQS